MEIDKEKSAAAWEQVSIKWSWKMDYCKSNGWSPAHKWAWDKAEEAWSADLKPRATITYGSILT